VKRILVTGGAGFIGSHTVDLLISRGHSVIVIDDLSTGVRENLPADVELHALDISNSEAMANFASRNGSLDAIVHCAAQASVTKSTKEPSRDLLINVLGTINVLNIATANSCPLVFASTGGAIYGNSAPRPTSESSVVEPAAPYGASKAAAEIYVRLWGSANALSHAICRLGNVYGPRQRGDGEAGVVAILAAQITEGRPVVLYGRGTPTRDYIHVEDVARALVAAIGVPGTFNIATGVETSVQDVYELVLLGIKPDFSGPPEYAPLRPGELQASCLDCSYAKFALKWVPLISASEGIHAVAAKLSESFTAARLSQDITRRSKQNRRQTP